MVGERAQQATISSGQPYRTETVIIGAGPAGLAVGACLRRAGCAFVILERHNVVGASWRRHYDRLHLHTDKWTSTLPFLAFPRSYPRYPSKRQVIDYLETYARTFQLEPCFGQAVTSARYDGSQWQVETPDRRYHARFLVVATGHNREPNLPNWPGQDAFQGTILHSSAYRNGAPFRSQDVLVVGLGNSGGEILIDLDEHGARPCLSIRSPVNVLPRDVFGLPLLMLAIPLSTLPPRLADLIAAPLIRLTIGDIEKLGLRKLPYGPNTQVRRQGRIPLIDVGALDLIKRGRVQIHPGIERLTCHEVVFTDGTSRRVDALILATGYRPRTDTFLRQTSGVVDADGAPLCRGVEASIPGLYFCGFQVSPIGMLRETRFEALRIAREITRRTAGQVAPSSPVQVR